MIESIYKIYARIFGRRVFGKFNKFLYQLALRGLGILNFQNDYLTGEQSWLQSYLKGKSSLTVVDVGANVGKYSGGILEINKDTNLIAFEPHPVTFRLLTENINGNSFRAFNLGVGDKNEELTLYDYDINDGSAHASLYRKVIEDIHKGTAICHSVKIVKLDDFLRTHKIDSIDLLKIDVEGNEFKVLSGAVNYLSNNKIHAIQFEFNEMNIISKSSFKEIWDLLPNYKIYRLLPGGELLDIQNYSPLNCEIYAFQNIVAILKDDDFAKSHQRDAHGAPESMTRPASH